VIPFATGIVKRVDSGFGVVGNSEPVEGETGVRVRDRSG
jgi:hypothetical protein